MARINVRELQTPIRQRYKGGATPPAQWAARSRVTEVLQTE